MAELSRLITQHALPLDNDLGGVIVVEVDASELERGLRQRLADWPRVMQYSATEIGRGVRLDFQRTTRSWVRRPEFTVDSAISADGFEVMVGTNDKIYSFVDRGTRAHFIGPKKPGGKLYFQWGGPGSYVAKSVPGFIGSQAGGPSGPMVTRKFVWHPGNAPRDFSKLIRFKWAGKAPDILRKYAANWATGAAVTPDTSSESE
jgi:hypothetical protein